MKKIFFVAITIVSSFASTFAQSKAPKEVVDAFNLKFPEALKVKWDKENATEYEANFVLNNTKCSANYSEKGKWLETESTTTFDKIPVKVREAFNFSQKKVKIKTVAKIENAKGEVLYEIEVKKGISTKEIFYNEDGILIKK